MPTATPVQRPLKKATYYVGPDQIRELKVLSAYTGRELSELVREALELYLKDPRIVGLVERFSGRLVEIKAK